MTSRFLAAALAAASTIAAIPAAAQVSSIAAADPATAIAASSALQAAYQKIGQDTQAERTQVQQLEQQRTAALKPFDTNNDDQLSEAEQAAAQANPTVLAQIQGFDQQINRIQQPITTARVYVVEQLLIQFNAAMQQAATQNNVQLVVSSEVVLSGPEAANLTPKITAALNQLVPTVSTVVPQGWQPARQSFAMYQQINDLLIGAAIQAQAQQQAAQQPAATPAQPVQGR